jgi:hypothetical protein
VTSEKTRLGQRDACVCARNALTTETESATATRFSCTSYGPVGVVLLFSCLIEKDSVILSDVVSFLLRVEHRATFISISLLAALTTSLLNYCKFQSKGLL